MMRRRSLIRLPSVIAIPMSSIIAITVVAVPVPV